jgi:PIN domain nuclease of toxin-antitoxin system
VARLVRYNHQETLRQPGALKEKIIIASDFDELPLDITHGHAHAIKDLPGYHSDPFDRMLVAQAKVEGFTLITRDVHLKKYRISILAA